jgi:hypothetical protein
MSEGVNNNQHYITESFIKKRFGVNGFVQRYDIKHDSWKPNTSPQFIFSGAGYTQLLEEGQPVDNSLETSFSKLESELQFILPALDDAATRAETKLPEDVFNNLCFYCAYLNYLSPFAKAKAPANFLLELNFHLGKGNWDYLKGWGISEEDIQQIKAYFEKGFRFVFHGENYLQFMFRMQFVQRCQEKAVEFRQHVKWTVYNSPLELPISDMALFNMPYGKVTLYILPICPERVLIGELKHGTPDYFKNPVIYGGTLPLDAANQVLDFICYSAVKAVVCRNKMDVKGIRERAKQNKVAFTRINNLDDVLTAGTKVFDRKKGFRLVPVTTDEYVKYVHSHIAPES